ncbi:MAG TPA: hypothetical protein VIZ28_10970, partial [Chitinophagaceae bacterium]
IKQRITDLGYNSVIKTRSNNRMEIKVDDVKDTLLVRQTITRNNKIEFMEVYTLDELPGLFETADMVTRRVSGNEDQSIYTVMSPLAPSETDARIEFPAAVGVVSKKDTAVLSHILRQPSLLKIFPADLRFCYGILTDDNIIQNIPDDLYLYAIRTRGQKARIQNNDIQNAFVRFNFDNGRPEVLFYLNKKGKAKWSGITKENIGRYLVITLDGVVITAPKIFAPDEGGRISLQARFTPDEANKLANQLKTGMLAADLAIIYADVSGGDPVTGMPRKILVAAVVFIIFTGLALFTFNSLKNK